MTTPTDPEPTPTPAPQEWVVRWEDPDLADHPVIPRLRARTEAVEAGREEGTTWGVVQEDVVVSPFGVPLFSEPVRACYSHPRVDMKLMWSTVYARYLGEAEYDEHLRAQLDAANGHGAAPPETHPDSV